MSETHEGQLLADECLSPAAAMGSSQPIIFTKRAVESDAIGGLIECKRLVKCNAIEWSVPMQSDGQVECNFAGGQYPIESAASLCQ